VDGSAVRQETVSHQTVLESGKFELFVVGALRLSDLVDESDDLV
jgi:hypothetical protein